jgi:hypothetical protein
MNILLFVSSGRSPSFLLLKSFHQMRARAMLWSFRHTPPPTHQLRGYLARLVGEGSGPGVIVLHDAASVSDDLRHQAHWLAGAGSVWITLLVTRSSTPYGNTASKPFLSLMSL